MKIIHLGDLHIGKSVNGFSMIDDQKHIINEIMKIIEAEAPQAVILAGDIYDKPTPSAEAVTLMDSFLTQISSAVPAVFLISGNHDSPERLAFGSRLMKNGGVYISPAFDGKIDPVVLRDEYGEVGFYSFPFMKPAHVRSCFEGCTAATYEEAFDFVVKSIIVPSQRRNVAIAHQFIIGAQRGGSEEVSVGGLDEISHSVFQPFDYTALGHIHRSQRVGCESVRYSGSVLKYSFSEATQKKSLTVVELFEKGRLEIRTIPLAPLRDMREIKGKYDEITLRKNYEGTNTDDYVRIILTDENEIPDAIGRLRSVYPNIMEVMYRNARTTAAGEIGELKGEEISPMELFESFYARQNNAALTDEQRAFMEKIIEEEWEGQQ